MIFLINMSLSVSKLYKIFIYLAHAVLIINKIKDNKFVWLYKIIFYREINIAYTKYILFNITYIVIYYYYIYILITASLNFSNLYIVEIDIIYI